MKNIIPIIIFITSIPLILFIVALDRILLGSEENRMMEDYN